jgi:hypothetical protein
LLSPAILAAICAALAIAAPTAMAKGKTIKYEGAVDLTYIPSPNGFADPMPYIEFKVTYNGKTPKTIPSDTVRTTGLYKPCDPSSITCPPPVCLTATGLCEPGGQCSANTQGNGSYPTVRIGRKRGFASRRFGSAENPATISGKIGKHSVTGTIDVAEDHPASDPSNTWQHPAYTCDTGPLTFHVIPGNAPFPG